MTGSRIITSCLGALFAASIGAQPFEDVTDTAGFYGLNSSWCSAWADMDNDGDQDLITLGHVQIYTGSISQLWRNNGDGTFNDVTFEAGYWHENGDAHGVVWSDFDNDGDQDFYVVKGTTKTKPDQERQEHDLMRNNGDGSFTNVALDAGVLGIGHRGRAGYAVDYDLDGDLEIFFTSYDRQIADKGNVLYLNDGDLHFVDVAPQAGISRDEEINRTASWADYNNDGYPDLLIMYPCTLYTNQGNGTFRDSTQAAGISPSYDCSSSAWSDYDNDGLLDVYITSGEDGTVEQTTAGFLYHNNGDGTFSDVTLASGTSNPANARGVVWGDYDNDGLPDLYLVNNTTYNPSRLLRNQGDGTFTDVTTEAGVGGQVENGMAVDATFVDYNNDGALDLFTTNGRANRLGEYLLLKNPGNTNHWLKLEMVGRESNRDGNMARVRVTSARTDQMQEQHGPSHYMCQDSTPLHFGLDQSEVVERLEITWPGGGNQIIQNLASDQDLMVEQGVSIVSGLPESLTGPGCYVYHTPLGWNLSCIGEADKRYDFSGQITTDGALTAVIPVNLEPNDSVSWDNNLITFEFHSKALPDTVRFLAQGERATFDILQNGLSQPRSIKIGQHHVLPGMLPVTLSR
jgi:hypothetical protein